MGLNLMPIETTKGTPKFGSHVSIGYIGIAI
jgi:hypothetical protein